MTADNLREVIGCLSFLAFHTPVMVSTKMAKPIRNMSPVIGIKKALTMLR